jgi:signal transduction histidine kinase
MRQSARLGRVAEGLRELARGNYAHRVILPGDDEAARMAEELNRLADAIQRERETTAARDAARRQLLANISHDLRTPITSIAGYVDALQRGLGDEPGRYLAVLAQKTNELAQLTDDLFYSARIDAGDLELKSQRLDLAEAVRRSILGFESQLSGRGVRVDIALPDEACVVDADPSAVSRILSNLVSNALHHGEDMTAFSVGMTASDAAYTVRIGNNGAQLPEDADRIFERGVAGPSGGTGLGLSIARELAEHMGASVSLESAVGGRATFALTFPSSATS